MVLEPLNKIISKQHLVIVFIFIPHRMNLKSVIHMIQKKLSKHE